MTAAQRKKPLTAPTAEGFKKNTDTFTVTEQVTAVNGLLSLLAQLHSARTRSQALLLSSSDELTELPPTALLNLAYAQSRRQQRERRLVHLNGQISAVKLALSFLAGQRGDSHAA